MHTKSPTVCTTNTLFFATQGPLLKSDLHRKKLAVTYHSQFEHREFPGSGVGPPSYIIGATRLLGERALEHGSSPLFELA